MRRLLVHGASAGTVCAILVACAGVPAPSPNRLSPVRDRVTDETIARDLGVIDGWGARAEALARAEPDTPNAAAIEAAREWVSVARAAYVRNDRSAAADSALARAVQLIETIERGGQPSVATIGQGSGTIPERQRALALDVATFATGDANASRIPEFGRTQVLLARAAHPFLSGPACVDGDPGEAAAAAFARVRQEADRRRSLSDQARQTPIPTPPPSERVPVTPSEPPAGMPSRHCREVELPATVHFAVDRYHLSAATRAVLDEVASKLVDRPDIVTTLDGNTDPRATEQYNEALSRHRATAVRDYLIGKGIDGSRLEIVASGERTPASPGRARRDHAVNRRVEMRYRSASGCSVRMVEQLGDLQLEPARPAPRERDE